MWKIITRLLRQPTLPWYPDKVEITAGSNLAWWPWVCTIDMRRRSRLIGDGVTRVFLGRVRRRQVVFEFWRVDDTVAFVSIRQILCDGWPRLNVLVQSRGELRDSESETSDEFWPCYFCDYHVLLPGDVAEYLIPRSSRCGLAGGHSLCEWCYEYLKYSNDGTPGGEPNGPQHWWATWRWKRNILAATLAVWVPHFDDGIIALLINLILGPAPKGIAW